jgi:hypothetical protein
VLWCAPCWWLEGVTEMRVAQEVAGGRGVEYLEENDPATARILSCGKRTIKNNSTFFSKFVPELTRYVP